MTAPPRPGTMRARTQDRSAGHSPPPTASPSGSRPRRDPGQAPAGYRQEYWHLAQYFIQACEKHGEPVKGVPIVYAEIKNRAELARLEEGDTPFERNPGMKRPPEYAGKPLPKDWNVTAWMKDMYRDENNKKVTWVRVGEAIIDRFWVDPLVTDDRSGDALSDLVRLDNFNYLHRYVVDRWRAKRSRKRFEAMIEAERASGKEIEIRMRRPRSEKDV